MRHLLVINGRLPGLNELIDSDRRDRRAGNRLKRETQDLIRIFIRRDLRGVRIQKRVRLYYRFYEPNRKRDMDNISGFAHKVIQDTLVATGVLQNDGWSYIAGMADDFYVDRLNPRIEVEIVEVEE